MKTRMTGALLALVLSVSMAGCSGAQNPASTSSPNSGEIINTSAPVSTPTPQNEEPVGDPANEQQPYNSEFNAYRAVLQSEAEFFSTYAQKSLYLNDFLTNQELYRTNLQATRFAVLDMDGDNTPEVVLELSVAGEPASYEILHYANGAVTGYHVEYRGLQELKADGTFGFSSGAADSGWGRMIFGPDALTTDPLAYSESSQGETELIIAYFVHGEAATQEAFDAFANEQFAKQDAVWHEFSQSAIETELSVNQ